MEQIKFDDQNIMVEDIKEEPPNDYSDGQLPSEPVQGLENPDPLAFVPPVTQRPDIIEAVPGPSVKLKRKLPTTVTYDESSIEKMIEEIRRGRLSMYQAAKLSGVPRTTLQYRMSNGYKNKGTRGPYKVFNQQEELEIVQQLLNLEQRGIPLTQRIVLKTVSKYLEANPRVNPFKEGQPGKSWLRSFLKRHSELKIQSQEAIREAELNIYEEVVRPWFRSISRYFKRQKLTNILDDSSRILNGEMIGFIIDSDKDSRHDYSLVDIMNGCYNMTALCSFAADGSFFAPQMIFPREGLTKSARKHFPDDWKFSWSNTGRMEAENLIDYVRQTLRPALDEKGTELPVLYFVRAESAMEAADLCLKYGVILVPLYSGARLIFQNADTTVYKKLRSTWTRFFSTWRADHTNKQMTMAVFGKLFAQAVAESFDRDLIRKGFSSRGLYPFDPSMIDYSNSYDNGSLAHPFSANDDEQSDSESEQTLQVQITRNVLDTALDLLGKDRIKMYLKESPDYMSQEDKALSYIYKSILLPAVGGITLGEMSFEDVENNIEEDEPFLTFETEMLTESDDPKVMTKSTPQGDSGSESNDSDDSDSCLPQKRLKSAPEKCQMNEVDSSSSTGASNSEATGFAKEHICSYPRITAHFCTVAKKTKYQSCFLDVTGMYVAYLKLCGETAHKPVSSKVYSSLLQKERANDPKLSTTCDECKHVEQFDAESEYEFLNK